jgi:uncharacterized membrane protein YkvA (DUF1232 family)
MIQNAFFDLALKRASRILGKKQRLVLLLGKLGMKLRNVEWNQIQQRDIKEKFLAIARMFKAYAYGRYTDVPWKTILLITATIIYFVSPLDLIPDVLLGIGFTDDFAILLMVYNSLSSEMDKFLTWEKSQVIIE